MASVHLDPEVHQLLKALAEQSGESMQTVLLQALERERRRRFLESVNEGYQHLSPDEAGDLALEHRSWATQ